MHDWFHLVSQSAAGRRWVYFYLVYLVSGFTFLPTALRMAVLLGLLAFAGFRWVSLAFTDFQRGFSLLEALGRVWYSRVLNSSVSFSFELPVQSDTDDWWHR